MEVIWRHPKTGEAEAVSAATAALESAEAPLPGDDDQADIRQVLDAM